MSKNPPKLPPVNIAAARNNLSYAPSPMSSATQNNGEQDEVTETGYMGFNNNDNVIYTNNVSGDINTNAQLQMRGEVLRPPTNRFSKTPNPRRKDSVLEAAYIRHLDNLGRLAQEEDALADMALNRMFENEIQMRRDRLARLRSSLDLQSMLF